MPNNKICKKGLVVGIILLLVGISVLSSVSSKYVSVSDEKIVENDVELEDIPLISPTDNYTELITYIDAFAYGFKIKGIGLGLHIEIWALDRSINLEGYRCPVFPLGESHFYVSTDHVIAPHFIGVWWTVTVNTYSVKGIAIGNIEWSV